MSINIWKQIKAMASTKRNDFHEKECTGITLKQLTIYKEKGCHSSQALMQYLCVRHHVCLTLLSFF